MRRAIQIDVFTFSFHILTETVRRPGADVNSRITRRSSGAAVWDWDTHWVATERESLQHRYEPTWQYCPGVAASVVPWRRTAHTQPWCSTCPKSSQSCATWLACSGTTPILSQPHISLIYYRCQTTLHIALEICLHVYDLFVRACNFMQKRE